MTENDTNPADLALDVLLYAPLGFALEARELLPKLAERGKQQVTMARMMGQFAVQQGQTMAGRHLGEAQKQAVEALAALGLWPKPATNGEADQPEAAPPAPPAKAARARKTPVSSVSSASSPSSATSATAATTEPAPPAKSLAIPDYDSLSASQVVPRLDGLSAAELETVRRYESAKRGRKTILGKIGQLQKR